MRRQKEVADTFLKEVWKLDGLASAIVSDMDPKFWGEFWESLCKALGIKQRMSTVYHPQTDGQTERTRQVLEGYLRNFVNNDKNDWFQMLPLAEYAHNNSKASEHKLTPFRQLRIPSTDALDEGERGSKPRSHNVYTLDENSAGEGEDNPRADERGHEEIRRPESDTTARHPGK